MYNVRTSITFSSWGLLSSFKANTVDIPHIMRVDDTVNNKALSLANDEFISSSESL